AHFHQCLGNMAHLDCLETTLVFHASCSGMAEWAWRSAGLPGILRDPYGGGVDSVRVWSGACLDHTTFEILQEQDGTRRMALRCSAWAQTGAAGPGSSSRASLVASLVPISPRPNEEGPRGKEKSDKVTRGQAGPCHLVLPLQELARHLAMRFFSR